MTIIPPGFLRDEATGVVIPCLHFGAVPVESLMGETVAKLCPSCDQQLPARFVSLPIALNRASGQENAA